MCNTRYNYPGRIKDNPKVHRTITAMIKARPIEYVYSIVRE
jgi:hypothetical protein